MNKRIFHVVNDLSTGGVSSVLYDLVKNHSNCNYNYHIISLVNNADKEVLQKFKHLDVEIIFLKHTFQHPTGIKGLYQMAIFEKQRIKKSYSIINAIASLKPDILHFHTLPTELYIGRGVASLHPCVLVYTDHSTRLKINEMKSISAFLIQWPYSMFYKNYHVIAVSQSVKNYLIQFNICRSLKSLTVITNKLEGEKSKISYQKEKGLNLVYVSRIFNHKGHEELIQAYKKLPVLGLTLFIVGPDALNGKIQRLAEQVVNNKIIFTGLINNIKTFLLNMDIGLFPSHKEGLPIALLEKMQVGLPCIVSDIEELTNIIDDGINGLVYKKGDAEDLKNKMIKLVNDKKLRENLGRNAVKKIEDEYVSKLGGIDKEYEEYYNSILLNGK